MVDQAITLFRHLRYSTLTATAGIRKRYILLSFDCDRAEDAKTVGTLGAWLKKNNIYATFAVPGTMLSKFPKEYLSMKKNGFDFINHGFRPHMKYNKQSETYDSDTFYAQMTQDEIVEDIIKGDKSIGETLGIRAKGFRAPHFGKFQKPNQLALIYKTIESLNYSFSSSTVPSKGIEKGAIYRIGNLWELPLSGTFDNPNTILDSWSFIAAPNKVFKSEDYQIQFKKLIDFYDRYKLPCIINLYADPSHIYNFEPFFSCLKYGKKKNFEFVSFDQITKAANK